MRLMSRKVSCVDLKVILKVSLIFGSIIKVCKALLSRIRPLCWCC